MFRIKWIIAGDREGEGKELCAWEIGRRKNRMFFVRAAPYYYRSDRWMPDNKSRRVFVLSSLLLFFFPSPLFFSSRREEGRNGGAVEKRRKKLYNDATDQTDGEELQEDPNLLGVSRGREILRPISLIDRSIKKYRLALSVEKLERRERKICIACNLQPRVLFK